MNSYPTLIDGRPVDTPERDDVVNPALGAPFAGRKWGGIGYESGMWGYHKFTEMQVMNVRK